MKLTDLIEKGFKKFMPSPFTIAILLTFVAFLLALLLTSSEENSSFGRVSELMNFWSTELWNVNLLAFAVQMMLMLVLGHVLALTKPIDKIIGGIAKYCNNTANAALLVTLITVLTALFNWGLGLIVGAILARKVGEHAARNNIPLNYGLIGAAGYSGLMVWHGGLSGSAPLKAAEANSITSFFKGTNDDLLNSAPSYIGVEETLFSPMNIVACILLIVGLPLFMYWLGRRTKKVTPLPEVEKSDHCEAEEIVEGAEKLDASMLFSVTVGGIILIYSLYQAIELFPEVGFNFITPNYINLLLFGLCLLIHGSIRSFLKGIDKAIGGASGILIQFPLYFGILGIMKHSGLIDVFSDFFVSVSSDTSFSIYTFFSAGLVNVFVPSGGGQWAVQGPIIIQTAQELNASIPESIMALSYGDQITNMLQPFWALPLLGITGLKAKEILPYTVALMGIGTIIFITVLLLF